MYSVVFYNLNSGSLKTESPTVPGLLPEDMIDRTFLMPPQEDGTRVRAKIVQRVNEHKDHMLDDPERAAQIAKSRCIVNKDYEEIVAHNDIIDYIEQDNSWDGVCKFNKINNHKKVKASDPEHKGSSFNVQVEWETGKTTWEPSFTMTRTGVHQSDPVTVAIHVKAKRLIDPPGWKLPGLKKRAKTWKQLL